MKRSELGLNKTFAILCCLFGFISSAVSMEENNLVIYTEHFPPYNYQNDNEIVGINHDIVATACQMAKINCQFELYPWRRAMELAKKSAFSGLVSTSRVPSREPLFQWVGPLASSPACFYKIASRDDIKIENQNDLKNFTVGLIKGDVYEEILQSWGLVENQHYINYSEKFGDITAFKRGKLDLFIASANTLQFHIDGKRIESNEITPAFIIDDPKLGGNFLALNLAIPKNIQSRLQQAINQLNKDKMILKFKQRYLPNISSVIPESEYSLNKRCRH